MDTQKEPNRLKALGLATCLALGGFAPAAETQAETERRWPQDVAVIDIATPREGNLLHLRGLAGQGTALFRVNGDCHAMPVRFVAGDFSGQMIDVARAEPIRMVIIRQDVIKSLLAGRDLVSDMVHVTTDPANKAADLYLAHGLSAQTGFVINPGSSLIADMLGADSSPTDCDRITEALPLE